jgi:hypothetical protein
MASFNYSLPELKSLMREHKIKGHSVMNKPEIKKLLVEREIIPKEALQVKESEKEIDPKHHFLRKIRLNPKRVIVRDNETDSVEVYPSMYRTGKVLGCTPKEIKKHDGKQLKGRYQITIEIYSN